MATRARADLGAFHRATLHTIARLTQAPVVFCVTRDPPPFDLPRATMWADASCAELSETSIPALLAAISGTAPPHPGAALPSAIRRELERIDPLLSASLRTLTSIRVGEAAQHQIIVIAGSCDPGSPPIDREHALHRIAPLLERWLALRQAALERNRLAVVRRAFAAASEVASGEVNELDLSPRELRTARLLVAGYAVINIAAELGLSEHTVRTYIRRLYRKLQVHDRAALVRRLAGEAPEPPPPSAAHGRTLHTFCHSNSSLVDTTPASQTAIDRVVNDRHGGDT